MTDSRGSTSAGVDNHTLHKEWDDISCPICVDHPHNAVLLLCSSHEKGCRSYICDTSYRHSNCLDRFKNHTDSMPCIPHFLGNESLRHGPRSLRSLTPEPVFDSQMIGGNLTESHEAFDVQEGGNDISTGTFQALEEPNSHEADMLLETQGQERMDPQESEEGINVSDKNSSLRCPLCRGVVLGYMIEKEVRQYLDQKPRNCSREGCVFSGNYRELRRHARRVHPTTRPADVDPSRRRAWHHLEREREFGDVISALQSTSPGAIVIGDYVIDSGDGLLHDRGNSGPVGGSRSWLTTFFLLQMLRGPLGPLREPRRASRSWRTHRRSGRRNLWDVDLLDLEDENNDGFVDGDEAPVPRRRRRFMRSRTDDDGHER